VPPPHCSSPERIEDVDNDSVNSFVKSINPLMLMNPLTQEERECMKKEVTEDMEDMTFDEADDIEECINTRHHSSDSDDSANGKIHIADRILYSVF